MQRILEVVNLFKVYNVKSENVVVLRNINFEVNEGEFLILFGPSGCGKSTLINSVLGLELISSGKVNLFGQPVAELSQDELAEIRKNNIGIVYQQPNWIKSLNVIENVAFPLIINGIDKEEALAKASEKLELVDMLNWKEYSPSDLSSGQQQKVALARALINNPKMLIADEPTGNLDYKSSRSLMDIFKGLSDKGIAIVLVTHNLVNLNYADKVARMFDGEIVEMIEPKALTESKLSEILQPKEENTNKVYKLGTDINKRVSKTDWQGSILNLVLMPFTLIQTLALLFLYSFSRLMNLLRFLGLSQFTKKTSRFFSGICDLIEQREKNTIKFFDLADISLKNLFNHRSRTIITIGGIAVGVSFTVLLFSIGFGFEQVIISRVTQLQELNLIDVSPLPTSNVFITNESVNSLNNINGVSEVLPIIGIAGKTNYENSIADVVVKGVTDKYFDSSEFKIISGQKLNSSEKNPDFINIEDVVGKRDIEDLAADEIIIDLPVNNTEAVVNEAVLQVFNLSKENAIGKKFKIKFIATNSLIGNNYKISSTETEYTIVGVVSYKDEKNIYIPAQDLVPLGVQRYSEAKIIAQDISFIKDIRISTEALGFRTRSIQDTISQVQFVFDNIRLIFGGVGIVALFIASLGMFNTLTVSLLERIREVGLMKAIGVKSKEIKKLFITEATLMGFLGGFFGIMLGLILGFIVSSIISAMYISRGGEYINITFLPLEAALAILLIAVIIGILTGYYPSSRATKISALDALRHE